VKREGPDKINAIEAGRTGGKKKVRVGDLKKKLDWLPREDFERADRGKQKGPLRGKGEKNARSNQSFTAPSPNNNKKEWQDE